MATFRKKKENRTHKPPTHDFIPEAIQQDINNGYVPAEISFSQNNDPKEDNHEVLLDGGTF